jgi:hypothetical protein
MRFVRLNQSELMGERMKDSGFTETGLTVAHGEPI